MDFLDEIAPQVRHAIDEGFYDVPQRTFRPQSLRTTIEARPFSLIPVIERCSPVEKELFAGDAGLLAGQLAGAGAHALSVVCEPTVFQGNLADVVQAKQQGLPVLYKDFVIDPVQITAACHSGADAILLIKSLFDKGYPTMSLDDAIGLCHELGLETLLEVFTLEEFEQAMETQSDLLGINNRNLKTLKVNLAMTEQILKKTRADRPVISESGVKTQADVRRLADTGARAALVGTVILRSSDPAATVRKLLLEQGS